MPYALNANVLRLFKELRKASNVFPDDLLDLSTISPSNHPEQRQAIDQLYSLFDVLIQIFNDLERNADLLTSSAIALIKEKDSLADHRLFFTDCHDAFKGHQNEFIINEVVVRLSHEYDLLIQQYDVMVDDLLPSKEVSLKELLVLLQDVYAHFLPTQHKEFLDQLVLTIQYIKQLDETPANFNSIDREDLMENLNKLFLLSPLQVKSEIEKINSQLILKYEIMNFRSENPIPHLPTELKPVEVPHHDYALMISRFAICLFGLSFFATLTFLIKVTRQYDQHDVSEGYCSANYHL